MTIEKLKDYIGFGIAGNFAHHLDQAGEAKDFIDVEVDEENAPKGLFPFYQPIKNDTFLNKFPLSSTKIILPTIKDAKVQMEPEVALICELVYSKKHKVKDIKIKSFCAYNDCSIREPNAPKISQKKNWGEATKGISTQSIDIDKFELGGVMDSFHIVSYLKSNGELKQYGEDSAVLTYNYFYDKLKNWMIDKLNTQEDFGPLENLKEVLEQSDFTENVVISIGATSYTEFGEYRFLEDSDEIFVCVYDKTKYIVNEIEQHIKDGTTTLDNVSILHQTILNSNGLYLKGEESKRIYKKYLNYEYENLHKLDYCYERKLQNIFSQELYDNQIENYLKQSRVGKNKIICDFECEEVDLQNDDIETILEVFKKTYPQKVFFKKVIIKCLRAYQANVVEYDESDEEY